MNARAAPDWRRDWLGWFMLIAALASLGGVLNMAANIGRPFGGYIEFNRTPANSFNEIDGNTPVWWPAMNAGGFNYGDDLLEVDGRPDFPDSRLAFDTAAEAGRDTVDVLILRPDNEEPFEIVTPIRIFTLTDFLDVRLPDLITATTYFLLAVVVYSARPAAPVNRAFALVATTVAITRTVFVHTVFFGDGFLTTSYEVFLQVSAAMIGFLVIRFAYSFPVALSNRSRVVQSVPTVFLVGAIVAAICMTLSRAPSLPGPPWPTNLQFDTVGELLTYSMLLVSFLLVMARIIWRLFHDRDNRRRTRVSRIVLVGLLVSLPMVLVTTLGPYLLDETVAFYFYRGLDLRYLLLAVPMAFAFVLVRYQAMQAPSPLFVFVMAIAASALLSAIGAWFWTLVHPGWPADGTRPPFAALFFMTLIASVFWSTQTRWKGLFARTFEWERRSYASSSSFGRRLRGQTNLNQLPQAIADGLVTELDLEQAAVWVANEDVLRLAASSGYALRKMPEEILLPDLRRIDTMTVSRLDPPDTIPDWLRPLDLLHLEVAVPLVTEDAIIGLLALGRRWDEGLFDDRDLEVAELVGQQATLHLLSAQNIDELRRVPAQLADAQERERMRLAEEIHDTILQFLGRLPLFLSVSRDNITRNPDKSADLLDQSIADVEEAAAVMRQIRHNLAPSQLESGLEGPLVALTTRFYNRANIPVRLTMFPELNEETDLEARHALYRVIQQALDNVEEHAQADEITVDLYNGEGRVKFRVEDNGQGSTPQQRKAARAQGSFGLQSMQARLDSLGGEFLIETEPGQGTIISGWIPVRTKSS